MKYIVLFLFALVLGSCDPAPQRGADGYKFGQKQYENSSVQVTIVTYKSRNELLKEASKYGVTNENLAAFSLLSRNDASVCTIHMIDPSISYEPEFVGHEFLHCIYGQWHTDNNSRG